ncbi:MAG: hypothetical protein R2991_01890 [Thermoanaerobaculia bacterium]
MTQSVEPAAHPERRWPLVAALVGACLLLGLAAGTAIGSACCVPEGSGLAGPAIALGYGLLGAILGGAVAGLVAWRTALGTLRVVTWLVVGLGVLTVGALVWRARSLRADHLAASGRNEPLPPPSAFRFESQIATADAHRPYRDLVVDGATWTARWTAVGPEAATCTATLVFDEADAIFGLRSAIRDAHDRYAAPCDPQPRNTTRHHALREGVDKELTWEISADLECLQDRPEILELERTLGWIVIAAAGDGRAHCDG